MKRRSSLRFVYEGVEGVLFTGGALLSWPVLKHWLRNWGSHADEREQVWAGDQLISANMPSSTRAIDVAAPASTVWQWIVQFGLGRAGFYSYELLERVAGIPVKNVESIESSLQEVAVGDEVLLHPKAPGIPIALVEPERHLVFCETRPEKLRESQPEIARSWSFYVAPVTDDSCRLLVRGCFEQTRKRSLTQRAAFALEQPIDFAMEVRMLRTVRRLAEAQGVAVWRG